MLWPFDPLSNHVVFIFTPFSFEICKFAPFLKIFFFWIFCLYFDVWIGAEQNTISTTTPSLFNIY